jgi:hypothetical protein
MVHGATVHFPPPEAATVACWAKAKA